jgi:hypothetical protein
MTTKTGKLWHKLATALAASVVLGTGMAVVVGAPAQAATFECGSACDFQDPATFTVIHPNYGAIHCADDAVTAASTVVSKGNITLQLRYSARCRTAWARAYGGYTDGRSYILALQDNVRSVTVRTEWWPTGGNNWSLMMDDAGYCTRAQVYVMWTSTTPLGSTGCY